MSQADQIYGSSGDTLGRGRCSKDTETGTQEVALKVLKLDQTFACSEDWNAMDGDARRRHCAQCDRHLVNFSKFTEKQALRMLKQELQEDELCGVFNIRDGRILFQPEPIRFRNLSAAAVAVSLSLPLLGACGDAGAEQVQEVVSPQQPVEAEHPVQCENAFVEIEAEPRLEPIEPGWTELRSRHLVIRNAAEENEANGPSSLQALQDARNIRLKGGEQSQERHDEEMKKFGETQSMERNRKEWGRFHDGANLNWVTMGVLRGDSK